EVADLAGVDADRRETLLGQVPQGPVLVAAGGFHHDAGGGVLVDRPRQGPVALGGVGKAPDGGGGPQGYVPGALGDTRANDAGRIDHAWPFLAMRACPRGQRLWRLFGHARQTAGRDQALRRPKGPSRIWITRPAAVTYKTQRTQR